MSRIYFHSQHGTSEVHGSERGWLSRLVSCLFEGCIGDYRWAKDWIDPILPPGIWSTKDESSWRLWLGSYDAHFLIDGQRLDMFVVALNTAILLGNDVVKLAARLHGQCEIHAWVDGPNRKWLASIMRQGLERKILRDGPQQGWPETIALLESRDDEPVVTSFSVTEQFPGRHCLAKDPGDKFYNWKDKTRWDRCMAYLREDSPMLEMKPETWDTYAFNDGQNVFTLRDRSKLTGV